MRRHLFGFLAFLFGMSIVGVSILKSRPEMVTLAVEEEVMESGAVEVTENGGGKDEYPLPYPGMLPDHPLYFIKMVRDRIRLWLTRNSLERAELMLHYADKRAAASLSLAEKGEAELAVSTAVKAEIYLQRALQEAEKAQGKGIDSGPFYGKALQAFGKHQKVLLGVQSRVPEEARSQMESAMEKNRMGQQELQQRLGKKQEMDEGGGLRSKEGDFVLYRAEGTDSKVLSVQGDGKAEFIHFGANRIIEFKAGEVPVERFNHILETAEREGFFELRDLYSDESGEPGAPIDPHMALVTIAANGKEHTVGVTSDEFPTAFSRVIEELMGLLPLLTDQPSGSYIQAQEMKPKDVEVLRLNQVEINELNAGQLAQLPALEQAVLHPGSYVYLPDEQAGEVLQYEIETGVFHGHIYVSYAGRTFDISVLEKTP